MRGSSRVHRSPAPRAFPAGVAIASVYLSLYLLRYVAVVRLSDAFAALQHVFTGFQIQASRLLVAIK